MDNLIIESYGALRACETQPDDLDLILRMEEDPANDGFIIRWTRDHHLEIINDPDSGHWRFEAVDDGRTVGYAILHGLNTADRILHWRRLVIAEKGRGFGHDAMRLVKKAAFGRFNIHRLWFDVFEDNARGIHLYRSEGFVSEGLHRDCLFANGRYRSQYIMSMLSHEYKGT